MVKSQLVFSGKRRIFANSYLDWYKSISSWPVFILAPRVMYLLCAGHVPMVKISGEANEDERRAMDSRKFRSRPGSSEATSATTACLIFILIVMEVLSRGKGQSRRICHRSVNKWEQQGRSITADASRVDDYWKVFNGSMINWRLVSSVTIPTSIIVSICRYDSTEVPNGLASGSSLGRGTSYRKLWNLHKW